ncbi:MAG: hypothetical protein AB8B91_09615 [Rubripirellula sp.]
MTRPSTLLLIFLCVASASIGCKRPDPAKVAARSPTSTDTPILEQAELPRSDTAKQEEGVSEKDAGIATEEPEPSELTQDSEATDAPVFSETFEPEPEPDPPSKTAYRLWLPTSAGPLVVGVEILIDEQPLRDAFEQQVSEVMESAREKDSPTWTQLFDLVSGDATLFGQSSSRIDESQHRNLIQRYDRNSNGRPESDEVMRFLFRDAKFSTEFRLVGTDSYREINRSRSVVFQQLDQNSNGKLDVEEIRHAEASLIALDKNADQRIDFEEVESGSGDDDQVWNKRRSTQWGEVAMDFSGYVDWSMLAYTLDEMPNEGPFGLAQNGIARLSQHVGGSINRKTARSILEIEPDLQIRIRFPRIVGEPIEIEQTWMSEQLASMDDVQVESNSGRFSLQSSELRVVFQATDLLNARNPIPPQAFAMLDANNDGGLDEAEIPEAAQELYSLANFDKDGDGKLTLREINEGMNPKPSIWSRQVRGRAAEVPDGVLAWLDQNADGFLSTREIQAAPRLLESLGALDDLRPIRIPDTYVVRFGRGEPSRESELFRLVQSSTDTDQQNLMPSWARAMDSNRDGDISAEEFPGTRDQFAEQDKNSNGFIEPGEIL